MGNTVCISIYALFNKYGNNLPSGNYIHVTHDKDMCGYNMWYYDLYDKHGNLVCMDGEECQVWYASSRYYKLVNKEGDIDTEFFLTMEEYNLAAFASR